MYRCREKREYHPYTSRSLNCAFNIVLTTFSKILVYIYSVTATIQLLAKDKILL